MPECVQRACRRLKTEPFAEPLNIPKHHAPSQSSLVSAGKQQRIGFPAVIRDESEDNFPQLKRKRHNSLLPPFPIQRDKQIFQVNISNSQSQSL
jgi:hypothetical protein